jgi:uncharacterized CHY-type Zn-finger protein
MTRLNELIKILSEPAVIERYAHAKATKTCKICGGPATRFRDTLSSCEYAISAICQTCQDIYFHDCSPSEEALSSS